MTASEPSPGAVALEAVVVVGCPLGASYEPAGRSPQSGAMFSTYL